jgi:hypothetical protein
MKVAMLTGGGDCPGLNAVLRAVVRKGERVYDDELVGLRYGWRGAIDRLHTTSESHSRVIVCEVMGRHAGHIATWAGIAGGAAMILIPEEEFDIEEVCQSLRRRHERGSFSSIVVVAEGAMPAAGTLTTTGDTTDEFGNVALGGIGTWLADEIEERTGYDTRVTILGHIQRGAHRPPTTGSCPPGSASRRSPRSTTAISARWWLCGPMRSCGSRSPTARASRSWWTRTSTTRWPRSSSAERPSTPMEHLTAETAERDQRRIAAGLARRGLAEERG